jgi:putative salt-induced outer membrane protein
MKLATLRIIYSALCLVVAAGAAFGRDATGTNAPPKSPPWSISAAAGLTLTRGNTRTLLTAANLAAARKWDRNELSLGADGAYGENDSVKNTESLHGFSQYNRMFTERFFGYLRLEGLHDGIADINYRISFGPGVGYYFIKNTNTTFRVEAGPGYIYERDGDDSTHSYMDLRLAERLEQRISATAKGWESLEILPQVDKFSNYIVNAEVGVEAAMTKKLSLQTYLQDTFHSEPVAGRQQNDLKLVAGVKYKF